jgi:predicted nuclease of predicted toxin-antitoxin system
MRFIVDAQLPYGLALWIREQGHDVLHTDDLPDKERSSDTQIRQVAEKDNRIVISKDSDFLDTHLLTNSPAKLLWVSTGNIRNRQLFLLFEQFWPEIERNFGQCNLLEMNNNSLLAY